MLLEPLEVAVLQKLLDGDHPLLAALRLQQAGLSVMKREFSGAGFFTEFAHSDSAVPASVKCGNVQFGDVVAVVENLQGGAGFLLYIQNGMLHMLEGYSYEEPWPESIGNFSLSYSNPDRTVELGKLC